MAILCFSLSFPKYMTLCDLHCRVTRTLSAFLDRDTLLAFETALSQAGDLDTAFEVQHPQSL